MRWWYWRNTGRDGLAPDDVRMFVLYQQSDSSAPLERSVGVKNASYGVVNAVASRQMAARNRIIITHELLHILGATDKYELSTGQPLEHGGLAEPYLRPVYPQNKAEIMAGHIALSQTKAVMPVSLQTCLIGSESANEIGWD